MFLALQPPRALGLGAPPWPTPTYLSATRALCLCALARPWPVLTLTLTLTLTEWLQGDLVGATLVVVATLQPLRQRTATPGARP